MKNTLMFLLVSLLLAFSLTACGGGQTNSTDPSYGTGGADANYSAGSRTDGTGPNYSTGSQTNRSAGSGVMGGTRDAMDDMGRDVRNAMDDAGRAVRNTVNGIENAM